MERCALVTGGAGFVGRYLTEALAREGTEVRVLDNAPEPDALPAGVTYIRGSVLDRETVRAALVGVSELFHLAAIPHLWAPEPALFSAVNAEGTRVVLDEAARAKTPRIIVTSTEAILRGWRDRRQQPVTEADLPPAPPALAGPYTRSKAQAHEHAMRAMAEGVPVSIVYPTIPVGARDPNLTAPTRMLMNYLSGATPAYLDSMLNLVAVEDVAAGHILAARKGDPHDRFILAGTNLRLSNLLALLRTISGRPMPSRRVPFPLAYGTGLISTFIADHLTRRMPTAPLEGVKLAYAPRQIDGSKAQRLLGLVPTPIEQALRRAVEWLQLDGKQARAA